MTESRKIHRKRRPDPNKVPRELADWFAGKVTDIPWCALLPRDCDKLPEQWERWHADHPDVPMSADVKERVEYVLTSRTYRFP